MSARKEGALSRRRLIAMLGMAAAATTLGACAPAPAPTATPAPAPKPAEAPKPAAPAPAPAPTATPVPPKPAEAPKPAPEPTKPAAAAPTAPAKAAIANPPTTPEQVDAIELKGKNVEVVYWHQRPQKDQDFLQGMLDEFNKSNPHGIKARAEIGGASYNDLYNKVNAAIQAGQPPDMSVAYQNQAAFYRGQGAVVNLSPFMQSKQYGLSDADLKDYFQTFLDSDANPQFKGERLGFPTQRSMEVMYCNLDWLKQLGYDAPPKDWKTWEEALGKAADPAKNKYGWAFRHDASNFASQVFARGGRILAADGSAYVFNSQAGIDTLTTLQRLFKNKHVVEIPAAERYGEQNRFANGDIMTVFASSSGLPFYQEAIAKGAKFKWDIALLPYAEKPAVNLYGASVSVYKTTPEKELAAWQVIKFLGEKAQTARWAVFSGYLPVRQSAVDEVVAAYKADPKWGSAADSYARMLTWTQYAMVESPVAGYDPVRDLIDKDLMSKVIADPSLDVKKLVDEAVEKANKVLKENAPKT